MTRRRRFEPAGLLAGLLFLAVAAGFCCEAAGVWRPAPLLVVPVLAGGLAAVHVVGGLTDVVRRRRDARCGAACDGAAGGPGGRGTEAPDGFSDAGAP